MLVSFDQSNNLSQNPISKDINANIKINLREKESDIYRNFYFIEYLPRHRLQMD